MNSKKKKKKKKKLIVASSTSKHNNRQKKETGKQSKKTKKSENNHHNNRKSKKNEIEKTINRKKKQHQKVDKLVFALLIAILLLVSNIALLLNYQQSKIVEEKKKNELEEIQKKKASLTDIIFLGDSITEMYNLEKYYHQPFINSGSSGWTTDDILNNLDDKVFKYKAKKIFLLIGTNDIGSEKDALYIYNNIKKIIKRIKNKNEYVDIYLESIYPINNSDDEKIVHTMVGIRTNKVIKTINNMLKKYCKESGITYINMYDKLLDDSGKLNINYTKDGLHLNEEGYTIITKELANYI